jgi:hypothetical protein
LAGIGGNSIAEVKATLTETEIMQWAEYRQRRGSLNIGRRVEQSIGNALAWDFNNKVEAHHRIDPLELMPHEDDIEISLEQQLAQLND